ncbi:MAG: toll/interleukin-1 receptor domain-containing protein, partial [Gammaproteobacteria bacterium]|nr:toll/interleukin-1 receptor domain-containing protein [Gammaproteobacteria bacterium]
MSDVFISYSGPDIDFVRHLFDQLTARARQPWADWQDIPPTADWLAEIYGGIEAADSFLFVISPDSVASEICTLEIEHAVKHNKRLVPVVWKDADDVHQAMSAHNWVFLRAEDDFEANFELLIDALDTDLAYIKEHTRLLTRAIEWHDNNRRRSDILRGPELTAAEGWLSISHSMEPQSAELHDDYITFSRATVNRLQRLMISSVTVAFVLMMGVSVFAFYQRNQANVERLKAKETARI